MTISDTYFNGGFDIKSDENSIRKVRSVKNFRLRRATAAQRPSIVRKSLYIDVLGKILDLRGGPGGPGFLAEKRGGPVWGGLVFRTPIATLLRPLTTIPQQSVTIALSHRKH